MPRVWHRVALGTLLVAFAGCAPSATQLIVVVDSDFSIPSELDEVRVTVTRPDGTMETEVRSLSDDSGLPLTLAVIAETERNRLHSFERCSTPRRWRSGARARWPRSGTAGPRA